MARLHQCVLIDREPRAVFALVSDPRRDEEFFSSLGRWEPRSRKIRGTGGRFRVLMRVGSIEAGGILRVTEWREPELIAWESESGVDQRGRWQVRPVGDGSELHLVIEFDLPGGPA